MVYWKVTTCSLLEKSKKLCVSMFILPARQWTKKGSSPVTVNDCQCVRRHTPQPTAITVNGRIATNVNAAVVYRI